MMQEPMVGFCGTQEINMKLFDTNYLKHLCQKYGLVPSKKYGQNYLISPEPIEEIIEIAEISNQDTVVEIGPGFGVLTFALVEKAKKVIAFEIERKIQTYWNERITQIHNIEIIWGNVLKEAEKFPEEKYKVVANLPYQITSEAIRKFLEARNKPELMVFMVQKEVAERICAKPGDMSVLSVAVQYYADPEIVVGVSRSFFWPEPAVDSAIIIIKNIKNEPIDEYFFKLVKTGFANRRKFLLKNLLPVVGKQNKEKLKQIFADLGLNEKVRAQELSVSQWKELARLLA